MVGWMDGCYRGRGVVCLLHICILNRYVSREVLFLLCSIVTEFQVEIFILNLGLCNYIVILLRGDLVYLFIQE